MDALKSAGRALIRSPSLAKQSWGCGGGRHRSECVRVRRGPGLGVAAHGPRLLRGPGVGREAGPDPAACGPGATFPGPAWLRVSEGQVPHSRPHSFRLWRRGRSWGKKRELGVPRCGLQVGGGALRDPGTSPLWTARGGGSSASVPGRCWGEGTWGRGRFGNTPPPRPLHSGARSAAAHLVRFPQSNPRSRLLTPSGARKPTQVRARASPVPAGSWGRGSTWGLRRCFPPAPSRSLLWRGSGGPAGVLAVLETCFYFSHLAA